MANTPQARKRVRQNDKRRVQNTAMRSRMRTRVKKVRNALDAGNAVAVKEQMVSVCSILDSYARKGLLPKNKASRLKSRINAKAKALSLAAVA